MSKIIEAIMEKLSSEAGKEFKEAVKDMHLLDNSKGEYVNRGKADADLAAANKSLSDMTAKLEALQEEAAKGGETTAELQQKLKETTDKHKAEIAELKASAERDKKSAQVKQALMQAGAKDADLAFTALGLDLDKLDYDDKGNLVGHSDRIKALQENKTFLFDVKEPENAHMPGEGAVSGNPWKKESFNLTEQGRILKSNPAKAQRLAAEAGITLTI